jgi:hypothetical protein
LQTEKAESKRNASAKCKLANHFTRGQNLNPTKRYTATKTMDVLRVMIARENDLSQGDACENARIIDDFNRLKKR